MRIKHVIGIAFTCMVFIFSCQAQSSTESHAGKNKQEQKIKPRHLTKAEFLSKVANYEKTPDKWEYLADPHAEIPQHFRLLRYMVRALPKVGSDIGGDCRRICRENRCL